jgi:hypothetical protein
MNNKDSLNLETELLFIILFLLFWKFVSSNRLWNAVLAHTARKKALVYSIHIVSVPV